MQQMAQYNKYPHNIIVQKDKNNKNNKNKINNKFFNQVDWFHSDKNHYYKILNKDI